MPVSTHLTQNKNTCLLGALIHRLSNNLLEANSQIIQQAGITAGPMPDTTAGATYNLLPSPKASKQMKHGAAAQQTLRCRALHTHHNSTYCLKKLCATSLEYRQMLLHQTNADAVHLRSFTACRSFTWQGRLDLWPTMPVKLSASIVL